MGNTTFQSSELGDRVRQLLLNAITAPKQVVIAGIELSVTFKGRYIFEVKQPRKGNWLTHYTLRYGNNGFSYAEEHSGDHPDAVALRESWSTILGASDATTFAAVAAQAEIVLKMFEDYAYSGFFHACDAFVAWEDDSTAGSAQVRRHLLANALREGFLLFYRDYASATALFAYIVSNQQNGNRQEFLRILWLLHDQSMSDPLTSRIHHVLDEAFACIGEARPE